MTSLNRPFIRLHGYKESDLLGLHLLIRDQGSDHRVEVVDIALDLLVAIKGERVQPDVLIQRFQRQMEDALKDGML